MQSFRLKNIKSFKDTGEIEIKPITVFVGKNSSGKSSLVRFPVLLKQTFEDDSISPIVFNGKYVDYGNFEDVVHNHEGDSLGFSFTFKNGDFLSKIIRSQNQEIHNQEDIEFLNGIKEISINIEILKNNQKIELQVQNISFDGKKFSMYGKYKNKSFIQINHSIYSQKNIPGKNILTVSSNAIPIQKIGANTFIHFKEEESLIKKVKEQQSFSERTGFYMLKSLDLWRIVFKNINTFVSEQMENIAYIGPFRSSPTRVYRDTESTYKYVGKSGEHSSTILKQAQKNEFPLLPKVSQWFQDAMGYTIDIQDIKGTNLFKIKAHSDKKSYGDDLIDVGFGISQILPIVIQLNYENTNGHASHLKNIDKTFIIEQPEIHLHPNAQAELANLFVGRIQDKRSKIIVETHSEHLIRRLQSLVANPDVNFSKDDVVIYYIDMKEEGVSTIQKMEMTETGQFKERWPSGFFDKAYLLSKELMRNAQKRKAQ